MDVVLVVALVWLFLLLVALAILRTAGRADREAERRLREEAQRTARTRADARRRARTTAVMVLALPLAAAAAGSGAPDAIAEGGESRCANAHSAPGPAGADATLCLINAARDAHGLAPLAAEERLARAARRHAADMVARAYFSHVTPSGTSFGDRLRRVGYASSCAWTGGETLAWGTGSKGSPGSRVAAWMRSPAHRLILLDPAYREAGVGIEVGVPGAAEPGFTYVADLGRRRC